MQDADEVEKFIREMKAKDTSHHIKVRILADGLTAREINPKVGKRKRKDFTIDQNFPLSQIRLAVAINMEKQWLAYEPHSIQNAIVLSNGKIQIVP